ncbi:hypothetical protein [Inhella crocodyli]|uniref:DUF2782 domain-containing protein n=1 Tax=Inhella crocodyli TaxID=2499851 RepID=A0A3S2URT9_9BURK|nr:hypothetical protein [Inhella crocodyli]RVT82894.1 hypothetical protein EOD73_15105 [Inhella crocodyli]
MKRRACGQWAGLAAALALSPLPSLAQPAPPTLSELPAPAAVAASAPEAPAQPASAPKRRCVAGCEGEVTRIRHSEDRFNAIEEHLNNREQVVKVVIRPKSGAPAYEILVGAGRTRSTDAAHRSGYVADPQGPNRREGQAVWPVARF